MIIWNFRTQLNIFFNNINDFIEYYGGMLAMNYEVHISDKDLSKYAKMHIDHGLQLLNQEINEQGNIDGFNFLIGKIENSLF